MEGFAGFPLAPGLGPEYAGQVQVQAERFRYPHPPPDCLEKCNFPGRSIHVRETWQRHLISRRDTLSTAMTANELFAFYTRHTLLHLALSFETTDV